MPRRADTELADALSGLLERGVEYHGQRSEFATVTQVTPALVLELQEGRESLSERAGNLVVPREQRSVAEAAEEDDSAVVTLMADGRYLLQHFVSESDDPVLVTQQGLGDALAGALTGVQAQVTSLTTQLAAAQTQLAQLAQTTQPDRRDYGAASLSSNFTTVVEPVGVDGLTRRFVITPAFDAWLKVSFHAVVANQGTDWGRIDSYLDVTPHPPVLPGQEATLPTWARDIKNGHPVTSYVGLYSSTEIPLRSGVTYTIGARIEPVGQTWAYFRGEFMWLEHDGLRRRT